MLKTHVEKGLPQDSQFFDEEMIVNVASTRQAIISTVDLSKIERKLREMCANKTSYKHFEVSSDKHMGLGEKTKEVLMEEWQAVAGEGKVKCAAQVTY